MSDTEQLKEAIRLIDARYADLISACEMSLRLADRLEAELAALKKRIGQANEALKIQGSDGNWDCDDYMLGMFNGMEFVVATIEGRETQYKTKKGAT